MTRKKKKAGAKAVLETVDAAVDTAKIALNAYKEAYENIDKLSVSIKEANAHLLANKQQSDATANSLIELAQANAELGFTIDSTGKLFAEVNKGLAARVRPGFDKVSGAITYQVGVWKQLGVEHKTSLGIFNLWDTALGKSSQEITTTGRVFQNFARITKQSVGTVFDDVAKSAESFLHIVGSEKMESMMLLFQRRAKSMGKETNVLMNVLEKFETMDSAADAAAGLNTTLTALGVNFDATAMFKADYAEKMNILAKAFSQAESKIETMPDIVGRKFRRSMASKLGISMDMYRSLSKFKPGQLGASDELLSRGIRPGAITSRAERAAAKQTTTIKQSVDGFKDAAKNMLVTKTARAMGMTGPGFVSSTKEDFIQTLGQGLIKTLNDQADTLADTMKGTIDKSGVRAWFEHLVEQLEKGANAQAKANDAASKKGRIA
jgi:hypothetical protein